jgi:hypothetical protein
MSEVALTLSQRNITLTLPNRDVNPQSSSASSDEADAYIILQGFSYSSTFTTKAFLLYGLSGTIEYIEADGILTLPRRKLALEVTA